MRKIGIIQAHSLAFHGGVPLAIKQVNGKLLIELVIERVKKVKNLDDIAIAAPDTKRNQKLFKRIAKDHNISVYFGEKDNVALRLFKCASQQKSKLNLILTGNDLAINPDFVQEMLKITESKHLNGLIFTHDPFSGGCSVLSTSLLKKIADSVSKQNENKAFLIRPLAYVRLHHKKLKVKKIEPLLPSRKELKKIKEILRRALISGGVTDVNLKKADFLDFSIQKYLFAEKYLTPRDIVLDIACGQGGGSFLLARTARKVLGIDIDETAIKVARKRYKKKNLQFKVGDGQELKFIKDKSIDKVVSFDTVEHVDEDKKFISEIWRVLKPNGLLIIGAPILIGNVVIHPYHRREYTRESFKKLLEGKGIKVKESYYQSNYAISSKEEGEGFLWVCEKGVR